MRESSRSVMENVIERVSAGIQTLSHTIKGNSAAVMGEDGSACVGPVTGDSEGAGVIGTNESGGIGDIDIAVHIGRALFSVIGAGARDREAAVKGMSAVRGHVGTVLDICEACCRDVITVRQEVT